MPKRIVTGVPDKIGKLYYKVLLCPNALRHANTLCIIYHQKGLIEEILDHQTKLCKMYSI